MRTEVFCRFDDDKNVASLYEELWEENMSSERVTIQLYLGEIVTLISEGMMSSSWVSKKKVCLITSSRPYSLCFYYPPCILVTLAIAIFI